MNLYSLDVMNVLAEKGYICQRQLAQEAGCSLGAVNSALKELMDAGYLNKGKEISPAGWEFLSEYTPRRAIVLAAGYGMRMVPINTETPKGLIEIHGEPLIERMIRQLQEAGIREIHIVVGFMKEQYEYLIDKYHVHLIVNANYSAKNNLYSLSLAKDFLTNAYVMPCDIWCSKNFFRSHELYSWYMVSDAARGDSGIRVNRKREILSVPQNASENAMVGIAYLAGKAAEQVKARIGVLCQDAQYDSSFWEESLYKEGKMILSARVVLSKDAVEINTYEQLRELDEQSNQLKSDAIAEIEKSLYVKASEIEEITVLKKGMTNRSFLFRCRGKKYIMRIPGEGTDRLINRAQEANVYKVIRTLNLCDPIVAINPQNGYKITEYISGASVCDPYNYEQTTQCMQRLRAFHALGLQVPHEFDLYRQIAFYESLWTQTGSAYRDYTQTKRNVLSLRSYIEAHAAKKVLTHIDAVPDNFLFCKDAQGKPNIRLIDWEYAGMQDPHVDIAMFCIYALYDRPQVDQLIDAYFPEGCSEENRTKIYCYIATCGLLWSNWCEYKRDLGVDFGAYSLAQYRYAKDYYKIAIQRMDEENSGEKK